VDVVYFKKAKTRVTRVVAKDWIEFEVPGYRERFFVELTDLASAGPAPLTTLKAEKGSTGDLYLTTTYLFANGIVGDLDTIKWPEAQGGSFAGFWRYLNSPARTPAIGAAIAAFRTFLQSRGAESPSPGAAPGLIHAARRERAVEARLRAAFPHPARGRKRHLDRVATSLVLGLTCGAIRAETPNPLVPAAL
jgi:hypothetical protein